MAGEGDLEHWREARLARGLQKTLEEVMVGVLLHQRPTQ